MIKIIKNKIRNTSGFAAIEFALMLPIFFAIILFSSAISDFAYVIKKNQTAATIASSLSSSLTGFHSDTDNDLNNITRLVRNIIEPVLPVDPTNSFGIVITFLQNIGGVTHIIHQFRHLPNLTDSSFRSYTPNAFNTDITTGFINSNNVNGNPALAGYVFSGQEQIVVVETGVSFTGGFLNEFRRRILQDEEFITYRMPPIVLRVNRMEFFPNGGRTRL